MNKYGTNLTIKTYGPVTGGLHGIYASLGTGENEEDDEPKGTLSITAGAPVKGLTGSGIYAKNYGYGSTSITVTKSGFVQGKFAGVTAYSFLYSAPITITNNGTIQNLSGLSRDLAIRAYSAYGGSVTVINNGTITGTVDFLPASPPTLTPPASVTDPAVVVNNGIWNTAGARISSPAADSIR